MDLRQPNLIVVTGAASGIGQATLRVIRKTGTVVVGVDLCDVPTEFAAAPDLHWVRGDVSAQQTWDYVEAAVLTLGNGRADCFVACAADIVVAPLLETTLDDWRRLFEINVLGVFRGFQTLLPAMVAHGRGAIAVVCSVNSFFVEEKLSAYSSSKAALLHMVRSAALEYARHGVRINAVCPGAVDTPLLQRHLSSSDDPVGARRSVENRIPTGAILRSEEVADILRFLISDTARGMSGAAVIVDGGLTTANDFDLSPTR